MNKFLVSLGVGVVLTGISYLVGMKMGWITTLDWLEVFCVLTSYSCTYLCVVQSRFNYVIGAVSVAALVLLFYNAGLYSSMVLNLYLFPTLLWGWFRWKSDADPRPVTFVEIPWWGTYLIFSAFVWGGLTFISSKMGATLPAADSSILAFSILAQFLLDQKKIETWGVWAIVNVIAINTYFEAGLFLIAFQYIFFLANTVYGAVMWWKSMKDQEEEDVGLSTIS